MSSTDLTLSSVVSGNPAASYATPGIGLFPQTLPLPVKLVTPSGGMKFFGASPISSPLVVSMPFCFAPYASASSTTAVFTAAGTSFSAPSTTGTTSTWSSALCRSSVGCGATVPLPPHTFVFASPPAMASPTSIDHGISFRAPFRAATNDDYLHAIAATVPASRITAISRVSGIVQVYFSDSSWARQLIAAGLIMRSVRIDVFPVGVSPKRVVVSAVPPEFPDSFVLSILASYGTVYGPVVSLPAATTDAAYKHVLSFRRACDVILASDAEFLALPPKVEVRFGHRDLSFFLNAPITCFVCTASGHTAQTCPTRCLAPAAVTATSRSSGSRRKRSRRARAPPAYASVVVSSPSMAPSTSSVVVSPLVPFSSPVAASGFLGAAASASSLPLEPPSAAPSLPSSPASLSGAPDAASVLDSSSAAAATLSDDGFTTVVYGKHRSDGRLSPVPLPVAPPSDVSEPVASLWPTGVPQYFFEPQLNRWTDARGTFTPLLEYGDVRDLATRVVNLNAASASAVLLPLAPRPAELEVLIRQLMVFAYTDPSVRGLPFSDRSVVRRGYHDLRRSLCRLHGLFDSDTPSPSSR